MTGALHEDLRTFSIISRWILLQMENVSDKSCRETRNTHFMFKDFFLENCVFYEIMWINSGAATGNNMAHAHCMLDT
jgi:hypothetical protein